MPTEKGRKCEISVQSTSIFSRPCKKFFAVNALTFFFFFFTKLKSNLMNCVLQFFLGKQLVVRNCFPPRSVHLMCDPSTCGFWDTVANCHRDGSKICLFKNKSLCHLDSETDPTTQEFANWQQDASFGGIFEVWQHCSGGGGGGLKKNSKKDHSQSETF